MAGTGDLKPTGHWGVCAKISAVSYHGGSGDGTLERLFDRFGFDRVNFSPFGRRAVARDDLNPRLDTPGIGLQPGRACRPASRH